MLIYSIYIYVTPSGIILKLQADFQIVLYCIDWSVYGVINRDHNVVSAITQRKDRSFYHLNKLTTSV